MLISNGQFGTLIDRLEKISKALYQQKNKSKLNTTAEIFSIIGVIFTGIIVVYAIWNYQGFRVSLEQAQESLDQNERNLKLTHQPIVHVTIRENFRVDENDPFGSGFLIKNSGKLPAKDLDVFFRVSLHKRLICISPRYREPGMILY